MFNLLDMDSSDAWSCLADVESDRDPVRMLSNESLGDLERRMDELPKGTQPCRPAPISAVSLPRIPASNFSALCSSRSSFRGS